MKKVFIGLLIVAAGEAIYYLLQKKNKPIVVNKKQQEQIIGKWKLDSLWTLRYSDNHLVQGLSDSKLNKYLYEFKKDGAVSRSVGDSLTSGSSSYKWNRENQLVWKENPADTNGTIFNVSVITQDSLLLQSIDSVVLFFKRVK